MVVDDDPQVLIAIANDLEKEYGYRFRILQANSRINESIKTAQ